MIAGDVGRELHEMSREGRWDGMVERVTEPILDAFVPTGTYAEITSVLREWYADLASGLVFPVPKDPAHDEAAAQAIRALRELPLSQRR